MAFNWELMVPYKYANLYITLHQIELIMLKDYHPEFVRRFVGWIHYKNGNVGVGGLSRTEQPNKPGFAPSLLVTFHWAGQKYNDGVTGACAVDTVFKDGPDPGDAHDGIAWREVPMQGSAEAVRWGIHANVGVPGDGESWHIQPVEIDGHASWLKAGRPAPTPNYPIPAEHDPRQQTPTPPSGAVVTTSSEWQQKRVFDAVIGVGNAFVQVPQAVGKKAVTVTLTTVTPGGNGWLVAFLGPQPDTTSLDFNKGLFDNSTVTVPVDANGYFAVYSTYPVRLIVNLQGVHS